MIRAKEGKFTKYVTSEKYSLFIFGEKIPLP